MTLKLYQVDLEKDSKIEDKGNLLHGIDCCLAKGEMLSADAFGEFMKTMHRHLFDQSKWNKVVEIK